MGAWIRSEGYRLWHWRRTTLAGIGIIGFMVAGIVSYRQTPLMSWGASSAYLAYLSALGSGANTYWDVVLPLMACLVAADSIAWDRRTGLIRLILPRTRRWEYGVGKVVATTFWTTVVVGLGLVVAFGVAVVEYPLTLPHWQFVHGSPVFTPPFGGAQYATPYPMFLHGVLFAHPGLYLSMISGITVLSAIAWANLGLLFSCVTKNPYLVLAAPWLVYLLGTFALEFLGAPMFSPYQLSGLFVANHAQGPYWVPILWATFAFVMMGAVVAYFAHGRDLLD